MTPPGPVGAVAADGPMFPLRSVVLGAMVPTFLLELGVGAALPIIVTHSTTLGASLGTASLMAALVPIGQIVADLPAGAMTARLGDRRSMIVAGIVGIAGFVAALLARSLLVLAVGVLLIGAAQSVFAIARHAYLTNTTPAHHRARVMSTLAGVFRVGLFAGPFAGAALLLTAPERWAYAIGVVGSLLAVLVLLAVGDSEADRSAAGGRDPAGTRSGPGLLTVVRDNRRVLSRLGLVALTIAAVRGARQTVLPIWGEHIGLDAAATSLVFGVAAAMDMALFYPSGWVMDRLGRLWVGIPGMAIMGVALVAVPFTATAAQLGAVGLVLGLGNGMTSGILMTIGSDAAPRDGQARFLSAWRFQNDVGSASSPLVLAAGPALGSLPVAVWVTAGTAVAAIATQLRWLPRYSVHANRTTRRRAGLNPDGSVPIRLDGEAGPGR